MSHIDPGVEGRIRESADVVEEVGDEKEQDSANDANGLKQPGRWWFASTACPLLAGTFGPMASGFNICALVYRWRQYIPPGGTQSTSEQAGQTLPDPAFVVALNAVSLFCALIANASLLLNMAQRVRFSIAQPITISGFLLAGVFMIADLGALGANPNYDIQQPEAIPHNRHALTGAFYYGIFAATIYVIIGALMSLTVYGAKRGHFQEAFQLTAPQRTLMLQTMSFIAYLLLGALVYSHIEGWEYLNAVYWADVTLLTVGLGEYSPSTPVGKGLLFPFAIGGILMVGLVVGSIRSLVLDRGKEKMSARIVEKKRSKAVRNVNEQKQTIRISMFAKADFNTDPSLPRAERRKEEFIAMRKVQAASERERRWFGLVVSGGFALLLWFVGAAVFQQTEYTQQWTYLQALYFAYTSLLTIGYGDFHPQSNSGKAFFVIWSLLAVPSLTILISNMGDTIVKWFSDATVSIAAVTVLPGEEGFRAGFKTVLRDASDLVRASVSGFTPPGVLGDAPQHRQARNKTHVNRELMLDRHAERLTPHLPKTGEHHDQKHTGEGLERDVDFYHYVLARECRNVQADLNSDPPKQYSWEDWEYYLKLIEDDEHRAKTPGRSIRSGVPWTPRAPMASENPNDTKLPQEPSDSPSSKENSPPYPPAQPKSKEENDQHQFHADPDLHDDDQSPHSWTWLSNESPLMSSKSEAEWILDRLSAALERDLDKRRKGYALSPPIRLRHARRED